MNVIRTNVNKIIHKVTYWVLQALSPPWYDPLPRGAMADIYEWVGGRIRQVRRRAGLTQAELGERAGITPDYVGRIEREIGRAHV